MPTSPFWHSTMTDTNGVLATAHVPTVVGSPLVFDFGNEMTAGNTLHIFGNDMVQSNTSGGIGNMHKLRAPDAPATNKYRVRAYYTMPSTGVAQQPFGVRFRGNSTDGTGYEFARNANGDDRFSLYKNGTAVVTRDAGTPAANEQIEMEIGCHEANAQDVISCRYRRANGDYLTSSGTWSATPQDCITYTDPSPITAAGFGGHLQRQHTSSLILRELIMEQETPAGPVLSSPSGSATGKDAATAGATTDTASGTLYAVATGSATQPTASQIIAGQDHTGAAADAAGSVSVTSTGAKTIALTGITADAVRYMHLVHVGGANSNVVSSASFTCPTLVTTGTVSDQSGVTGAAFSWGGANPSTLRTGGIGTVSITGSGLSGSGLTVNSSTGVLSGTCGTVGTYNVVLTYTDQSTAGSEIPQTETEAFTLTIIAAGPTINTQPSAQTASEGATATFSVAATGTGTLTYQWQRAEPGSGSYSNVSGATSSSYTTGTLACVTDHSANYRVNVTDSNGTTASSTAALTVNAVTSTSRPGADVTVTGWSASTGSDLYAMVDEASPSDADYMISPTITGSTAPVTLSLQYPLATGSWLISVRLRTTSGTATARVYLLNAAGSVVGTSADQAITSTFTTYQLPITTSGVAARIRVEIVS